MTGIKRLEEALDDLTRNPRPAERTHPGREEALGVAANLAREAAYLRGALAAVCEERDALIEERGALRRELAELRGGRVVELERRPKGEG